MNDPRKATKKILLLTGIAITVFGLFLPLYTTCEETDEGFVNVSILGKDYFTYYLSLLFLSVIVLSSYFGKGSLAAVIAMTLLGGGITLFYNWIGQAGWGRPCGHSPTQFQNLLFLGHIMIIISCFMNISSRKKNRNPATDLLDQ
ncbi:MAG: hypothetical protein ACK46O_06110 [Flavobacteriia bacterium]